MMMFTPTQLAVVGLVFLLGLFLGMFVFAGSKWKRRYREELARREALEIDNERLLREARETESLHRAALRAPPADPDIRGPL